MATMASSHGGSRPGAGRKRVFGEPTQLLRIPESQVPQVMAWLDCYRQQKTTPLSEQAIASQLQVVPVALQPPPLSIHAFLHKVPAGFPSPADDYVEKLDLNTHLIQHPAATFIVRVSGHSMTGAGIFDGDELIVDRSLNPESGQVVVAVLDGELTIKRLMRAQGRVWLKAENPDYPDIAVDAEQDLRIWGVVTRVLHKV